MTVDARGIKATFERDGVYLARGVFDAATIDRLAADFDRIVAQLIESRESIDATWTTADDSTDHKRVVLHTHNVQNYSPSLLRGNAVPGSTGTYRFRPTTRNATWRSRTE